MTDVSTHLLEGDGIVSNLFYFIWKKSVSGTASPTTTTSIPSTIVFEHNFPKAWYYHAGGGGGTHLSGKSSSHKGTSTNGDGAGQDKKKGSTTGGSSSNNVSDLERRLGKDIDSQQILREFCTRRGAAAPVNANGVNPADDPTAPHSPLAMSGGGGGAAEPMAGLVDEGEIVATYFSQVERHGKPCTRVEFMNRLELEDFLIRRTRRADGFLQKWVPPTGKHNTVIEAVWSPHLCLVSKRQNTLAVRDRRYSIYERAVTFEGATHHSVDVFVAPHVKWQVQKISQSIVDHLYDTQKIAVQRMVLYFKVDQYSNIWLLWCGSLRVGSRCQLNLTPRYVRCGDNEQQQEVATAKHIAQLLKESNDLDEIDDPVKRKQKLKQQQQHDMVHGDKFRERGSKEAFNYPRPPSMGPIGAVYISAPEWEKRYAELQKLKLKQLAKERKALRNAFKKEELTEDEYVFKMHESIAQLEDRKKYLNNPGLSKPIRMPRRKKSSKKKKGSGGAGNDATGEENLDGTTTNLEGTVISNTSFSTTTPVNNNSRVGGRGVIYASPITPAGTDVVTPTHHPNSDAAAVQHLDFFLDTTPHRRKTPDVLWEVVRIAVRTGHITRRKAVADGVDWVTSFLYCGYSHFLCSTQFMKVFVPKYVTNSLTMKWVTLSEEFPLEDHQAKPGGKKTTKASATNAAPGDLGSSSPQKRNRFTAHQDDADGKPPTTGAPAPSTILDWSQFRNGAESDDEVRQRLQEERAKSVTLQWLYSIGILASTTRPNPPPPPMVGPSDSNARYPGRSPSISGQYSPSMPSMSSPVSPRPSILRPTSPPVMGPRPDPSLQQPRGSSPTQNSPTTPPTGGNLTSRAAANGTRPPPLSNSPTPKTPIPPALAGGRRPSSALSSRHGHHQPSLSEGDGASTPSSLVLMPNTDTNADPIYVLKMLWPLAEIQQAVQELLRTQINKPAAVSLWAFVAHKFLLEKEWKTYLAKQQLAAEREDDQKAEEDDDDDPHTSATDIVVSPTTASSSSPNNRTNVTDGGGSTASIAESPPAGKGGSSGGAEGVEMDTVEVSSMSKST